MNTRSVLLSTALASTLAALAPMQQAQAQEAPEETTRIVVTAQKQEQSLIDVPINIAVANQERLNQLGTDDIEEFADFVPGLQVQAQSVNTSSYSLRGVTSDGGRPRVAVFQNDVAIGTPRYGANLAMFDLERVEVVKGPQATLFGQGALVGGINFLQNRASLKGNEGWAKLDLGDYSAVRAEVGYNYALSDTLAVRVAGLVKNRDGYVDNLAGPDLMGLKTSAFRLATHWAPVDNVEADLFINYQEDDSTGTEFKSIVFAPAGGDLNPFTAAAMNVTPDQWRDKLGLDREVFSVTSHVAWDISDDWSLTSITDYRDLRAFEAVDADGTALTILQLAALNKGQAWSQELRFNYDASGPLTGFFGANFFQLHSSLRQRLATNEPNAQAVLAPVIAAGAGLTVAQVEGALAMRGVPGAANFDNIANPLQYSAIAALLFNQLIPLTPGHLEEQSPTEDIESFDLFGDVSYEVTDRLTLTGGLRWTKDSLDSTAFARLVRGNPYISAALGHPANAVTLGTVLQAEQYTTPKSRSHDSDAALTWRLNAAYRISPDLNSWVAIGRGRRPEALVASATDPTGFSVISDETFDNIEAGLMGFFLEEKLRVSTSAYYGQYRDFQTTHYDTTAGGFVTENSGNATQYGLEIEADFHVTDTIEIFGSYAHNFSEYDDKDDDGNAQEFAGNVFRLSPLNSLSLGADIAWPISAGEIHFVPAYTWKDDQFFEDDNDPWEFQEAYALLDLRVGFDAASGGWGLSLYVENALDEDYLIDGGNTGGEFGIPTSIRGVPRMAGVGAWLRY